MKKLLLALSFTFFASTALADYVFHIDSMSVEEIEQLADDVGGRQGKCVYFNALDLRDYNDHVVAVIPEESHGVRFYIEDELHMICTRFTEDYFDHDGELIDSIDYDDIDDYN